MGRSMLSKRPPGLSSIMEEIGESNIDNLPSGFLHVIRGGTFSNEVPWRTLEEIARQQEETPIP